MAQSLGTTANLYLIATHTIYQKKWKDALNWAAAHIPFITHISNEIAGKHASVAQSLDTTANLYLIATNTTYQKKFKNGK